MLRGIFYCQFDNILGPKIVHQTPEGFVLATASCISLLSLVFFTSSLFDCQA